MTLDWTTTAALFPGQGSQAIGMGADFVERFEIARDTFQRANDILGFDLAAICFQGPAETLNQTAITQPALYVSSLAIWRVLRAEMPEAAPAWLAGHSLGEFSALAASGAVDFEDGLRLVRLRGKLMQAAGEDNPGAMAAVLALTVGQVEQLCAGVAAETGRTVVLANDNCPGQVVVSGESAAVDRLIEVALAAGARRAVKLAVSVAAHSPLMEAASARFREAVRATPFAPPSIPVYGNVDAAPLRSPDDIRHELERQLTQAVRWTDSMRGLIAAPAETFIEIGSGNVLTGLLRRIDRGKTRLNLNRVAAFEALLAARD